MNSGVNDHRPEQKLAGHHAFGELLKRGALPYRVAGVGLRWGVT